MADGTLDLLWALTGPPRPLASLSLLSPDPFQLVFTDSSNWKAKATQILIFKKSEKKLIML